MAGIRTALEGFRLRLEHECRTLHGRYLARQSVLLEACDVAELAGERITAERGVGAVSRLPAGRVLKMRLSEGPRRSNGRATRGS